VFGPILPWLSQLNGNPKNMMPVGVMSLTKKLDRKVITIPINIETKITTLLFIFSSFLIHIFISFSNINFLEEY
jgi:hypothetical protein